MAPVVGTRAAGWWYRAAITPGVLGWMFGLLVLHGFVLPQGSAIGGFLRICIDGGRTRCFFPEHILLVPDGKGGWGVDEEGTASGPGVIQVVFGVRRWSVGLAAPTRRVTYRYLQVYDTSTMAPVTLAPGAAAAVRTWFANPRRATDFDEALAGRMGARESIAAGYVQNAVLGAQALGVAWCLIARSHVKTKAQRERRHRALGLCVACGYPVNRVASACPECGRWYRAEDVAEHAETIEMPWEEMRGGPAKDGS